MNERRKNQRQHLLYYGRIYDERMHEQLGYLIDITETGMMMLSERSFEVDKMQSVRIEVTDDLSTDKSYLTLKVKSIWCKPDINPENFNVGFEILQPTEEERQIIKRIVKSYGFRNN